MISVAVITFLQEERIWYALSTVKHTSVWWRMSESVQQCHHHKSIIVGRSILESVRQRHHRKFIIVGRSMFKSVRQRHHRKSIIVGRRMLESVWQRHCKSIIVGRSMLEFCPIVHTAIAIAAPQLCRVGRNEPYINMFVVFMVWCVYSIYSREMTIHPFVGGVYTLPANPT